MACVVCNTGAGNTGTGNTGTGNTGTGNTGAGNTGTGNTGTGAAVCAQFCGLGAGHYSGNLWQRLVWAGLLKWALCGVLLNVARHVRACVGGCADCSAGGTSLVRLPHAEHSANRTAWHRCAAWE